MTHPMGRGDRSGFRDAHKFKAGRAFDHVSQR
jgi:hypothetical protein